MCPIDPRVSHRSSPVDRIELLFASTRTPSSNWWPASTSAT